MYSITKPNIVSKHPTLYFYQFTIRFNLEETDNGWNYEEISLKPGEWNKDIVIKALVNFYYSDEEVINIINNALQNPTKSSTIIAYKNLLAWREKASELATELLEYAYENNLSAIDPYEDTTIHYNNPKPEGTPEWFTMVNDGLKLLQKQALALTDEEARDVPTLFPAWIDLIGLQVNEGERYYYNGSLWKVLLQHTVVEENTPESEPELYTPIFYDSGTADHPISILNLEDYDEGTYYTDGKKLFIGENVDGEVLLVVVNGAIPRTLP